MEDVKKYFDEKVEVVETHKRSTLHKLAPAYAYYWLFEGEHQCKYEDFKVLPLVAEIMGFAFENKMKHGVACQYPINTFAQRTIGRWTDGKFWSTDRFKQFFEEYRYMFPKYAKIGGRNIII